MMNILSKIAKFFYEPANSLLMVIEITMTVLISTIVVFVIIGNRAAAAKTAMIGSTFSLLYVFLTIICTYCYLRKKRNNSE